ncbi:MAG: hypothetical protein V1899_12325, partial [Planctomycetota bacterium]
IGVAIEALEAWFLADHVTLCDAMGRIRIDKPPVRAHHLLRHVRPTISPFGCQTISVVPRRRML